MNNPYVLLGNSFSIRNTKAMAAKAIGANSAVLIIGENGTGKTEVARWIHNESNRSIHQFISIPCTTIQENHFIRELSQAQNGTLFLSDIDKLSPRLQFVFFKTLQSIFTCQNPAENTKNIRLMASSSTDLEKFVHRGFFREDLYLKFCGITIYIPTLNERREDITTLINYFIQITNQTKGTKITSVSHDVMNVLCQYNWPNNIQEIESLLERIAILKNCGQVELSDLPPRLRNLATSNIDTFYTQSDKSDTAQKLLLHTPVTEDDPLDEKSNENTQNPDEYAAIDQFVKKEIDLGNGIDFYKIVEAFENKLLHAALTRAQQNKNKAAQLLAMNRTTLVEKLRKRSIFLDGNPDNTKTKYNSSFTVMDELGMERKPFEDQSYMTITND